jgi:MFS family permease
MQIPCLPATPSHRWKVLAAGVAANAAFSVAFSGIPMTAVLLRSGYRLDNATLGLVLGLMGLGIAVSELPWGLLTDRWGDRPVLLTGLGATALALLAMALLAAPTPQHVPGPDWLGAGLLGVGLLGGSVNGASGRAVMGWFAEGERGLAMSIRQTAVPLGGAIGALSSRVWRLAAGIGILCAPQFAVLSFGTVFLHDFGHLGLPAIAAAMMVVQVGAMVMRVWSGRWTDRRQNRPAYLRACSLLSVGLFAALAGLAWAGEAAAGTSATPRALLIALLATSGVCVSAWHGVAYTELATLSGAARAGTALGMANTSVFLVCFLTPLSIPHLLALQGWPLVWLMAAACAGAALPLLTTSAKAAQAKASNAALSRST